MKTHSCKLSPATGDEFHLTKKSYQLPKNLEGIYWYFTNGFRPQPSNQGIQESRNIIFLALLTAGLSPPPSKVVGLSSLHLLAQCFGGACLMIGGSAIHSQCHHQCCCALCVILPLATTTPLLALGQTQPPMPPQSPLQC